MAQALSGTDIKSQVRTLVFLFCAAVYGVLLFNFDAIVGSSTQQVCILATCIGVLSVLAAGITANSGFWSVQALYLLISSLFNLGQVLLVSFGKSVVSPAAVLWTSWIYEPEGKTAALLGSMALLACSMGSILAVRRRKGTPDEAAVVRKRVGGFSFGMLTASIVGWAAYCFMRAGGNPHIFFTSYFEFKRLTDSPFIDFFYWAIIVSLGILVSVDHKYAKWGLILFAIWALDDFMLGNRGPVLLAITAGIAVAAKRGKLRMNIGVSILAAVFLLSAISVVRDLRQYGAANFAKSVQAASPTDSLVELGGSLRPTVESIKFVREDGPRMGATYYAPFERTFLYYLVPGIKRVNAENDMRLADILISKRVGPIGFSTIAEAYLNFGFIGSQVILFLIGILLGRMDTWHCDIVSLTVMVAIFQPLLDHIRQSFVPFPIYLSCGIVVTLIVMMLVVDARKRSVAKVELSL